jgi:uncharacterized membrane protein YidH (DUF202 family)
LLLPSEAANYAIGFQSGISKRGVEVERRNKLWLIAILGIITVALATAAYLDYLSYQQWMQEKLASYPVELRPYIDFTPYFRTSRGFLWMAISVVVYGASFFVAVLQGKKKTLTSEERRSTED